MSERDVSYIKVEDDIVGIVGLKNVLEEMAVELAQRQKEDIGSELLNRLERNNYIPEKARESYAKALVREFRKFMGQPVAEASTGDSETKLMGKTCCCGPGPKGR
jgi:hypothetical protein